MKPFLLYLALFVLSACASFDRTHISPGERVYGPRYSFMTPPAAYDQAPWFASEYGNGHRIKLYQLNHKDSFTIISALNRGPLTGMYPSAEEHLRALQRYQHTVRHPPGFEHAHYDAWIATEYGALCVRYENRGEDHQGRANRGPAQVETLGLACAHPTLPNVLMNLEITRRADHDAPYVDLAKQAEVLFNSLEY